MSRSTDRLASRVGGIVQFRRRWQGMTRMTDRLASRVGSRVQLGRGGPDLLVGRLVAVHLDYMVVLTDDGIEYHVPLHHLKSIAFIDEEPGHSEGAERQDGADDAPATFNGFLASCEGRRLELYRHGPERAVGEVIECGDDYLALRTDRGEVLYYPIFHIRSVCLDPPETSHGSHRPPLPPPPPKPKALAKKRKKVRRLRRERNDVEE